MLFLNQANEPVARINGYRNVADFKQVLDCVNAKTADLTAPDKDVAISDE